MYIPTFNNWEDRAEVVAFMRQYAFATLVSVQDELPVATHLPFVVIEENGDIILEAHLARANEQWQSLPNASALVIFQEPHAYISPRFYNKKQSVPTWNYLAVHAYGTVQFIEEEPAAFATLERMITTYESAYLEQWKTLSDAYKLAMLKGIVPFRITITQLEAKAKLSQHKKDDEIRRITESLRKEEDSSIRSTGEYMTSKLSSDAR